MSRIFFGTELEGVATFWRIYRRDGVALGFTSHDRDLWFGGILHRAAPGMAPSSIRRTSDLSPDSVEVESALTHDSIASDDLAAGRVDGARVEVGAVDWETLESAVLYGGTIGSIAEEGTRFSAQLQSAKAVLERDPIPRTSPACRAQFCGPGCTLSSAQFTREAALVACDLAANRVDFAFADNGNFALGHIRWLGGQLAGLTSNVLAADANGLVLEHDLVAEIPVGTRALLREGCDHTLATCAARFANAANFQGEPFLPGNDLLAQYPVGR